MGLAAVEVGELRQTVVKLTHLVTEYATHQSWRCEHAPHWHLVDPSSVPEGDCPCGLLGALGEVGLAPEPEEHDHG